MADTKTIMIQGTGSGVGKSVIVAGLCRIFLQDGFKVAPFKAQNMALNSAVTLDGGEIGRAQALQAAGCKIEPSVDMNPILLKPTSDRGCQVIVKGRPVGNMNLWEYKKYKSQALKIVRESLDRLKRGYDIVVIEGAGSPAEINIKSHDIVNMRIARLSQSPVILTGDIDRGGVFAWLMGTLQLLNPAERGLIKGFLINKFRGDKRLLKPGIRFLENYTGKKVLGVIPYYNDINIPEEDSLVLDAKRKRLNSKRKINIVVIQLPRISNFSDFDALEQEPDVNLCYSKDAEHLDGADVIIIPGTKNTIGDLNYIKKSGLSQKIISNFISSHSVTLIGICGGYQMLGKKIYDRKNIESKKIEINGLGILPVTTEIKPEKILSQVKAKDVSWGMEVSGYEIHHGRTVVTNGLMPMFEIVEFMNKRVRKNDGVQLEDKRCWGTYIHGVFDNDRFRRHFLNNLRRKKNLSILSCGVSYDLNKEIDKLAELLRFCLDRELLYKILNRNV